MTPASEVCFAAPATFLEMARARHSSADKSLPISRTLLAETRSKVPPRVKCSEVTTKSTVVAVLCKSEMCERAREA